MVIECTFGRLKMRFRALKRAMGINLNDLPFVIYACFILHNYSEATMEMMDGTRLSQPDRLISELTLSQQKVRGSEETFLNFLIHKRDCNPSLCWTMSPKSSFQRAKESLNMYKQVHCCLKLNIVLCIMLSHNVTQC